MPLSVRPNLSSGFISLPVRLKATHGHSRLKVVWSRHSLPDCTISPTTKMDSRLLSAFRYVSRLHFLARYAWLIGNLREKQSPCRRRQCSQGFGRVPLTALTRTVPGTGFPPALKGWRTRHDSLSVLGPTNPESFRLLDARCPALRAFKLWGNGVASVQFDD